MSLMSPKTLLLGGDCAYSNEHNHLDERKHCKQHAHVCRYHMLPDHCSPTCANAWELPDETARSFLPELAVAVALACRNQGMNLCWN